MSLNPRDEPIIFEKTFQVFYTGNHIVICTLNCKAAFVELTCGDAFSVETRICSMSRLEIFLPYLKSLRVRAHASIPESGYGDVQMLNGEKLLSVDVVSTRRFEPFFGVRLLDGSSPSSA